MSDRLKEINKKIQKTKKKFNTCKYKDIKKLENYMYFLKCEKRKIELKMSASRHSEKVEDVNRMHRKNSNGDFELINPGNEKAPGDGFKL